jgi:site-specific DNA recombinase
MSGRQTPGLASARSAETTTITQSSQPSPGACTNRRGPEAEGPDAQNGHGKIAALYARVSTEKQEKEETIASQLAALRQAAAQAGYYLPPEFQFKDEGYSGARLDRPGLERLRDLVAEGAIEVLFVYAPDRLARNYAYQVVVLEELRRRGCEVVFLNHAFSQSPEEQMLLQIQGVFAEYERALIKERSRRGRLFAARQGRINWGNPPYGYDYIKKTDSTPQHLIVDEAEAEVVRQIYRWLIEEGLSSYAIERRLTGQKIPTRKRNGRGWCQSTIIEILRDPIYKGEAYYNRTAPVDAQRPYLGRGFKDVRPGNLRGRAKRPREEWILVRIPMIIDPEVWELAQAQLQKNREQAWRNNKRHEYLLRSLLICGQCGRRMVGMWSSNGGRYVCSARYPRYEAWSCDGRSIAATKVEPLVWEQIKGLLSNPQLLKARYEEGRGDPAIDSREEQEKERIERKLKALDREIERLIDAYQGGVIELDELRQRRELIQQQSHALRERVSEILRLRSGREQELRLLQGVEAFCASVRQSLKEPSFAIKQKVLQLVVDRVIVEGTKLTIRHVVPTGPIRLQTEHNLRNFIL